MAENAANSLAKGTRVIVSGRLEQRSWETENGDKRSIVEINADEIAPSLRFATAVVTKTPRAEGSNFSSGSSSDRPAPRTNEPSSYAFDEEPF
jgi:single-strand DNA-binding protein